MILCYNLVLQGKLLLMFLLWNGNQSGSLEGYTYVSNIQPFDKVKRTKLMG